MNKNKFAFIMIVLILISGTRFLVNNQSKKASTYVDTAIKKIPKLPLNINDVSDIGLYGYSKSGKHSNNRIATVEERTQIISWLNTIKKYDKKRKIVVNKNGKPDPSNIQIFYKDVSNDSSSIYLLEEGDLSIIIGVPSNNEEYFVKQVELNNLLKKLLLLSHCKSIKSLYWQKRVLVIQRRI